jgi:hypothetical protein
MVPHFVILDLYIYIFYSYILQSVPLDEGAGVGFIG